MLWKKNRWINEKRSEDAPFQSWSPATNAPVYLRVWKQTIKTAFLLISHGYKNVLEECGGSALPPPSISNFCSISCWCSSSHEYVSLPLCVPRQGDVERTEYALMCILTQPVSSEPNLSDHLLHAHQPALENSLSRFHPALRASERSGWGFQSRTWEALRVCERRRAAMSGLATGQRFLSGFPMCLCTSASGLRWCRRGHRLLNPLLKGGDDSASVGSLKGLGVRSWHRLMRCDRVPGRHTELLPAHTPTTVSAKWLKGQSTSSSEVSSFCPFCIGLNVFITSLHVILILSKSTVFVWLIDIKQREEEGLRHHILTLTLQHYATWQPHVCFTIQTHLVVQMSSARSWAAVNTCFSTNLFCEEVYFCMEMKSEDPEQKKTRGMIVYLKWKQHRIMNDAHWPCKPGTELQMRLWKSRLNSMAKEAHVSQHLHADVMQKKKKKKKPIWPICGSRLEQAGLKSNISAAESDCRQTLWLSLRQQQGWELLKSHTNIRVVFCLPTGGIWKKTLRFIP